MLSLSPRPNRKVGIDLSDYCYAAESIGCVVSVIRAVDVVESAGKGFLPSGRPKILFEGHLFDKATKGKFRKSHPTISYPTWTKAHYKGGESEYKRLEIAFALDPKAALAATSWSRFQILGSNYKLCGFSSVEEFVEAMFLDEDNSLEAFVMFVLNRGLARALKAKNFDSFAYGYNGSGYRRNQYGVKMTNAEKTFAKMKIDCRGLTSTAPTQVDAALPAICHESCTGLNNTSLDDRYLTADLGGEISENDSPQPPATDAPAENPADPTNTSVAIPNTTDEAPPVTLADTGGDTSDTDVPSPTLGERAAAAYDKAGGVLDQASGVATRVEQAKSIFNVLPKFEQDGVSPDSSKAKATTIWGTVVQVVMFVFAWICNIPLYYWAILAVILGLIAIVYLNRQTLLGALRENNKSS